MMGRHARQNELWGEPVNLARRIPADHPLRKLRERVQLDFVREEVAGSYGRKGNVSVDPVVVLKMMLLLFSRQRAERAGTDADHPVADRLPLVLGLQPGGRDSQSQRAFEGAAALGGRRKSSPGSFGQVWRSVWKRG
jgi:hypothetical protein